MTGTGAASPNMAVQRGISVTSSMAPSQQQQHPLNTLNTTSTVHKKGGRPLEETQGDPATCEIKPGQETIIEISKEKMGLGLSIVGGSDTLLVRFIF